MALSSSLEFMQQHGVPIYLQREAAECGLVCVGMVAAFHGFESDLAQLRIRFPTSMRGMSLKTVLHIANSLRLTARAVRLELPSLTRLSLPAILHWDHRHFVVLVKAKKSFGCLRFLIHDPATGARWISLDEMTRNFTGVAVELDRANDFESKSERRQLRISQLFSSGSGIRRTITNVLGLSLTLQIGILISPLFIRTVVDIALPANDSNLLLILSTGFFALSLALAFFTWLRSLVLAISVSSASFQLSANLVRKLLGLPLQWFTARNVGSIIASVQAVKPISDIFTKGLASSLVDGVLAIFTLLIMMLLSVKLTIVSLCALFIYGLARLILLRPILDLKRSLIVAEAAEYNVAVETVQGIAAIKLAVQEGTRRAVWQQKKIEVINLNIRLARLTAIVEALDVLAPNVGTIVIVYFGAILVMSGAFSLGTAFSFMLYKQFFSRSAMNLVQAIGEYKSMDVHLENVADIALCESERRENSTETAQELKGSIKLENIWFRYGIGENYVLQGVTIDVSPGQIIAIAGKSGGGKTTLMKIMQGLHEPNKGQIWIDGQPKAMFGRSAFRSQIGVVAQDDVLYTGTIASNISFFDPEISMERVIECAMITAIHDDILSMPMGYETICGELGSTLSGGQRQRILLARALYRRPKILFLDEGTAHLDVATENKVQSAIRELGITCIIVAHRPEVLVAADRVVTLIDGQIFDASTDTRAIVKSAVRAEN